MISALFRTLAPVALFALGLANLLQGCSPAANSSVTAVKSGSGKTLVTIPRTVVTSTEALSVNEIFDRGMRRLGERQYALAADDLEKAAIAAPEQPWAPLAFYNAGIARDESGAFEKCAEDFRRVIRSPTGMPEQRDAHVRLIRVLVYLEHWKEAAQQADTLVQRYGNLRMLESVVVRGAMALAEILEGDLEHAEQNVEAARSIIEEHQFDLPVKIHFDVAAVYFALGEIRRKRAEAIVFVPPPADFSERLEQRCQLVLDAQSAYSSTMRAYDSNWSIKAGYGVGILYAKLHSDLMDMLPLVSFESPERTRLFEAALRLRYSVLLEKALQMMDRALALAVRTSDDSSWVRLARESHEQLTASLAKEAEALRNVPYTREELKAALANLGKESKAKAAALKRKKSVIRR